MMPLDSANYISELNLDNPVGSIDTVDMTDDFFRELKKAIRQSFPNINKQVNITSDELNNLKTYLQFGSAAWNFQNSAITGVVSADNDTAVEPRSYNDGRYLRRTNNLSDLTDKSAAMTNLMTGLTVGSAGANALRNMVANLMYPVGSLYMNGSDYNNPRTLFGIGTWAAYAPGRVIVSAGSYTDSNGDTRTFAPGVSSGTYQHTLNVQQIPSHNHQYAGDDHLPNFWGIAQNQAARYDADSDSDRWARKYFTGSEGGDLPHNNTQPSTGAYIWMRTA